MKMKVQLEKQLPNIIGKNVNIKETIVGKVIEYDVETGMTTIVIDDNSFSKIDWNPIVGHQVGISSKNIDDFRINESRLFYWNSSLTEETKLAMLDWFDKLSDIEKQYVMNFRGEAEMNEYEAHYSGEEL